MNMKKIFLLSILLIVVQFGYAQNVSSSTIQWFSESTFQASTGDILEEETKLITNGTNSIEWRRNDGSLIKQFAVQEVIGSWTNVNSVGTIRYKISENTNGGTITINRTAHETKVVIALASDNPTMIELNITNINIQ